jgi:WD40 repeat protein
VNSVAFCPADDVIASASSDTTVRLWNTLSGDLLTTLEGHASSVWSVSWAPGGRFLATGSWDRMVRVWDREEARTVRILSGHRSYVRGVAFSPDGIHVASASWDRSVRVWDIRTGREVAADRSHRQPVRALAYAAGGKGIVWGTAYDEHPVRLWTEGVPFATEPAPPVLPMLSAVPDVGARSAAPPPIELVPGKQAWRDASHPDETHAAIQAALDAAGQPDAGNTVVVLPPGRYLLTWPIVFSGATLRGPGAVLIARNTTEKYFFGLTLGNYARLEDIQVVGEGSKCVPIRFANPASDVRFRDVHIREGTILVDGQAHIENIVFDSCLFEDGGYGLLLDRPSSGRNVRITNCTFRNNRSDAIELNFPHHENGNVVEDIVIADCIFEGTGRDPNNGHAGFSVGMAGARCVQIVGNSFRRAAVQAIHIEDESEQITISGNNFANCGVDHTGGNWTGGVHVLSGSRYIAITGNTFNNCRFGVSGLQAHQLRWCTITGNTFRNNEIGIRIMQFPRGVIQGNVFDDCQTAVNIWRTPLWNVSGNVIVTSRPGGVGLRFSQYQSAVVTSNTIEAPIPIDHREGAGDRGESLVDGNLLIPVE